MRNDINRGQTLPYLIIFSLPFFLEINLNQLLPMEILLVPYINKNTIKPTTILSILIKLPYTYLQYHFYTFNCHIIQIVRKRRNLQMVMVNGGRHFCWTPAYEVSKEEQSVKEATMSQLDKVFYRLKTIS